MCTSLQTGRACILQPEGLSRVQDVLWSNVGFSSATYLGAAVLAWTLFALLAIFYLIPVGAVQALLQVDKLERYKFFKVIMDVGAPASCVPVPGMSKLA